MNDLPENSSPKSKGHRLWMPIFFVSLAIVGVTIVRTRPELENNMKSWFTAAIPALAVLLTLIWFLLLSRFRWRVRLITAAVLALVVFGLRQTVRVSGTANGTGLPKFVWSWTPERTVALETPAPAAPSVAPSTSPAGETDVPQFFGPNRDGIIKNTKLTHDWTVTPPKELWRHPVGAGWSAFSVVGSRAYTQEQRGENEAVSCYDLLTGKLIWIYSNTVHFTQWQGGEGPRATPTVDHAQVFTMGATGILDCLDAATGKPLWSRHVLDENHLPNLVWGVSDSPLVFDDTVVVTGGLTNADTVLAYRRSNGEPMWHSGSDKASYSSPILATLAGKHVVLSFNAASLTVHDSTSGELLLSYPFADDKWPKASQPVVLANDQVFISAGYGAGCALLQMKATADGKLAATELWKNLHMKTQFNSVAQRDGFLYGLDDGALACVEIASGDRKWKEGRFGSGQTLLVDDLLIIQSEPGAVILAQAKPDAFKELGRIPALSSKTWNHPTLAGRYLLVRNNEEMACYELPVQTGDSKTAAR